MQKIGIFITLMFLWGFATPPNLEAYDAEALRTVVGREAVTLADGYELLIYLMELEEEYPAYEARRQFLLEQGIIKDDWAELESTQPLRRGALAYMLVKMLRLRGGLKSFFLGMNERFAMETLIHENIMRSGHRLDLMTGQELVVVMTETARFMLARP